MTDDDVKLPEPIGYLYHDSISDALAAAHPWLNSTMLVLAADRRPTCRNETPLYDEPTVRRLIAEAKAEEREACAALCEIRRDRDLIHGHTSHAAAADDCARDIRNRSKA